jgi:REP element-mobilizing transposase RayT
MTFWRNYYHLVWATKNRAPLIEADLEKPLYGYLIRKAAESGIYVYAVNSWFDHVHMIVAIPPKFSVADAVKNLKGASSHYINHDVRPENLYFVWQRGYGCLTLGETQRPKAIAYVENQKIHHQEQTTNTWLEHVDELDEGPADVGISRQDEQAHIRDGDAIYAICSDPYPF